jgi:hypothetical protein
MCVSESSDFYYLFRQVDYVLFYEDLILLNFYKRLYREFALLLVADAAESFMTLLFIALIGIGLIVFCTNK